MKFAPVLPINLYPALDMGSYHLVQAHLFPSATENTIKWFKDRNKTTDHFVILDNGVWELGTADVSAVYEAAALIEPSCVVLPDVFQDAHGTYDNVVNYMEMKELAPYVMVVPQGKNLAEWCACAYRCCSTLDEKGISFIVGIPKVLDSYTPNGRLDVISWLFDAAPDLRVHLLGLWHGIGDVHSAGWQVYTDRILGVDSTLPFAHAQTGEYTSPTAAKVSIKEESWTRTSEFFTLEEIWRARINISVASRHAQHAY